MFSHGCRLYINGCYLSCEKCSKLGTKIKHECTECKASYYFIDNTSNCINDAEKLASYPNYYFDPADNIFNECHLYFRLVLL